MKNEKEIIICVGLGVMVVDTAEDAAAAETMDGAGIAVEITEEIPIGEVSTMVMPSATGWLRCRKRQPVWLRLQ